MFDLLKKKLGSFVAAITGKEESKPAEPAAPEKTTDIQPRLPPQPALPEQREAQAPTEPAIHFPEPAVDAQPRPAPSAEPAKPAFQPAEEQKPKDSKPAEPTPAQFPKPAEATVPFETPKQAEAPKPQPKPAVSAPVPKSVEKIFSRPERQEQPVQKSVPSPTEAGISKVVREVTDIEEAFEKAEVEEQKKPAQAPQAPRQIEMPKLVYVEDESKQRKLSPSLGLVSQFKSIFTSKVTISEAETKQLFEELEVALLESDVSVDTSRALVEDLKKRLVGRQVDKNRVQDEIKSAVALSLQSLLEQPKFDYFSKLSAAKAEGRPAIVVFFGPNGAGKTTTIAKMASLLKKNGFSSVIAASDTFRAAAIEQAVHHGAKLDVRVVRHDYGADPAAVAFDAIKHAAANKTDVVLVDTAGRQETNKNLLEELRKIVRVAKPDAKLFVGESIAGHALLDQLKSFDEAVGIDAVILTKIDCDAKGGSSLSIARETKVPVIFMGVGQGYDELVPFDPHFIVNKVLEN